MSEQKRNVPKLRFPGFTDAWEQRKLGELCSFAKGRGYSKADICDSGVPLILYGRLYTQYQARIDDVDTFAVEREGSLFSCGNEVIVPASGETAEDIAVASSVRRSGIVLGGDLNVLTPGLDLDPDYVALVITYGKTHSELAKRAQGKSVVHIHNDDIAAIDFSYPTAREQRAISSLALSFDDLITLHQRKLDHLKLQKRGLLQKMFPRDGSDGPEIRFPGFTDAWEQRKLGEVAKIVGGGTPSTSIPEYWNGDIDWYSPTEIGDSVYAEGSRKRITKSGFQACSATMLPAERTILFTSRAGIGNMAILRRSGCTNQGFQSLVVDDCNDTYFIYSMGDSIKEYAERNASGSTFLEISGKQLACMSTMVPSLSEQALIGSFFRDLDDLITLHQRKLDHLKLQKKALLQQMFI